MAKSRKQSQPIATFTKPAKVTPADRKGSSTIESPVGVTWVTCVVAVHGATGKAATPANAADIAANMPTAAALRDLAIEQGVTFYTARTQVGKFRAWVRAGCDPAQLPKGVSIDA